MFLLPIEVMKSAWTSTWFALAKASHCCFITSLPAGTQWSQKPMETLPAAWPVRICTRGNAAVAAPSLSAVRRETCLGFVIRRSFPLAALGPLTQRGERSTRV